MVKKTQVPQHILDAALALAGEKGWGRVSLADIAARSRMPLPEVYAEFPSKVAIVDALLDQVDHAMLVGPVEAEGSVRDRLFDVVMRRIDAMKPYKDGLRALMRDGGGDPVTALCGARRFLRSMALLLEAAGISASGLRGLMRIEGMSVVYLYTLRAWMRDDSADAAVTMAALDRALRRAETLASLLWRGSGGAPPASAAPSPPSAATP